MEIGQRVKLALLFFVFFLALPIVYSAPAIKSVQMSDQGYIIDYPKILYFEFGQDVKLNLHVFNASNGIPKNTSVMCYMHVYNRTGNHIAELSTSTPAHEYDYEFTIKAKNFTYIGDYSYIAQCNSTTDSRGGFVSIDFEVLEFRNNLPVLAMNSDTTSGISITVFLLIITIGLFWFSLSEKHISENHMLQLTLKRCALVLAIYFTMLNTSIIATIAQAANIPVMKELLNYVVIFGWAGYVAMVYLIVKLILDLMEMWNINKRNKRGLEDE